MYERKCQQFVRVPLLIVDDFALKLPRAPHDEDFHDLVAARYKRAATMTSNLDLDEWGDAFPDKCLAQPRSIDCATVAIGSSSKARASVGQDQCPKAAKTSLQNQAKTAFLKPFEIAFRGYSAWPH
ncbi:Mobile element protein [Caballeronia sordidicola]|uniref:Mobile element protein n=1 Tax=Caballeronia sordidicola TaxID=196367 RepID=A0A242MUB0_CABSO|nr:ATP-binding protein [Caballeronia sordidicola]OTP74902.1 Mobile element protein [Caballeronia sordidicola]